MHRTIISRRTEEEHLYKVHRTWKTRRDHERYNRKSDYQAGIRFERWYVGESAASIERKTVSQYTRFTTTFILPSITVYTFDYN